MTTAGIGMTLALTNPATAIATYPSAQVTYNQWGNIIHIKEYQLGIEIGWAYDLCTGTTSVSTAISSPSTPPRPREKSTRVAGIESAADKGRGQRAECEHRYLGLVGTSPQ